MFRLKLWLLTLTPRARWRPISVCLCVTRRRKLLRWPGTRSQVGLLKDLTKTNATCAKVVFGGSASVVAESDIKCLNTYREIKSIVRRVSALNKKYLLH
ncbi:MAG: hypothetical protein C0514_05180 [Candidatus Puniceispirillum sp.]|nr:hypothetical protein [Candidatus Puniceispirillum sp.]